MEFSFEYYNWLRNLNEAPQVLIFISIFGSILFLIAFGILRWIIKMIGLTFISEWKFLDDFMICTSLTGFFGGFLIMIFTFMFKASADGMAGIRLLFVWIILYICVFLFYMTNKAALKKWYHDMTSLNDKSKKKPQKRKKK